MGHSAGRIMSHMDHFKQISQGICPGLFAKISGRIKMLFKEQTPRGSA